MPPPGQRVGDFRRCASAENLPFLEDQGASAAHVAERAKLSRETPPRGGGNDGEIYNRCTMTTAPFNSICRDFLREHHPFI